MSNFEIKRCHVSGIKLHKFRRTLFSWYSKEGRNFPWRKKSASNYEVILAEVFLQRTRAETVEVFFREFSRKYPSWKTLSKLSESRLGNILRPIGLWRRRASSLKLLAKAMSQRNGRFPKTREEIEELPGVGQYIANAVQLFCHGECKPLLDVNMARVLERVFKPRMFADIRYDPHLQSLSHAIVKCKRSKELNWAILDLGAKVCVSKTPHCIICPLKGMCNYAKNNL